MHCVGGGRTVRGAVCLEPRAAVSRRTGIGAVELEVDAGLSILVPCGWGAIEDAGLCRV